LVNDVGDYQLCTEAMDFFVVAEYSVYWKLICENKCRYRKKACWHE